MLWRAKNNFCAFRQITVASAALCFLGSAFAASTGTAEPRTILLDANSGIVLHANRSNAAHPPASLAKLMTLYLVFDGLDRRRFALGTRWTVSRHAALQIPSKIHLSVGEQVSVRHLISAIVVKSANDAAVTIAEGLAGSEGRFVRLMNRAARRLGMRSTRFRNATGLDRQGQVTTARDMAILARALLRHFPERSTQFAQTQLRYRGRTYRTSNKLLRRHWPVDGMKIGYTTRAGYSFVASARVGGRRLIAVVLGERSARARFTRTEQLIAHGLKLASADVTRQARRHGRLVTVARFDSLDRIDTGLIRVAGRRFGIQPGWPMSASNTSAGKMWTGKRPTSGIQPAATTW